MRWGVLDIGSNTGHLAVFESEPGQPPRRVQRFREMLRLAERVHPDGALTDAGLDLLVDFCRRARVVADEEGADVLTVATATIRDAPNRTAVLAAVREASGFELVVLSGEEEARATFLAARRWLRWSGREPGRIAMVDIGGGSLEIATGVGELPDDAMSWGLGAGRLARAWDGRPAAELRAHVHAEIAPHVDRLGRGGLELVVGTSQTMRMLGRICGVPLTRTDVAALLDRVAGLPLREIARVPGVKKSRADQVLAGATVAHVVMDLFSLESVEICPWALREGVLMEHLDRL